MRLVQLIHNGQIRVARVRDKDTLDILNFDGSMYELAKTAIQLGLTLQALIDTITTESVVGYQTVIDEQRLLPPLTHPDPAHMTISGTGLTHLGSADSRNAMHAKQSREAEERPTDSMQMFMLGLAEGKPAPGFSGAQPEWFYKGDGSIVVAPGSPISVPAFARDAGEEPELAGLYIIADNGQPYRLGFVIGNEFSDHVTERYNYLWLAHSKIRYCSFGPELLIGDLPESVEGHSRIWRNGSVLWEKRFLTGEKNMSHSIANLEHHHFKYAQFCRPGHIHAHFFGTATLSFADGVLTQDGDIFEIGAEVFGRPLRNRIQWKQDQQHVAVNRL